jgi:hypothetical protein
MTASPGDAAMTGDVRTALPSSTSLSQLLGLLSVRKHRPEPSASAAGLPRLQTELEAGTARCHRPSVKPPAAATDQP